MNQNSKWGAQYWKDLGERVGSAAVAGLISIVTADSTGTVSGDPKQWWLFIGLPSVLVTLKGLFSNLGGSPIPSASIVNVSSLGKAA